MIYTIIEGSIKKTFATGGNKKLLLKDFEKKYLLIDNCLTQILCVLGMLIFSFHDKVKSVHTNLKLEV